MTAPSLAKEDEDDHAAAAAFSFSSQSQTTQSYGSCCATHNPNVILMKSKDSFTSTTNIAKPTATATTSDAQSSINLDTGALELSDKQSVQQNSTDTDSIDLITQTEEEDDEEIIITQGTATMMIPRRIMSAVMSRISTILVLFNPFINRCLQQPVVADKLSQYSLLNAILLNGKYLPIGFLGTYILFLSVIWIPLWVLAQLISELGVYLLFVSCIIFGGRCLLRLLAFPGTNVRVYGEIEKEFVKYSCKMLEGACIAMEEFAKSLLGLANSNASSSMTTTGSILSSNDEGMGTTIDRLTANYNRVKLYENQVLGVFWEVLHCLYEDHGEGTTATNHHRRDTSRNKFHHMGEQTSACKETCKQKLCCERTTTARNNYGDQLSNNDDDIGENSELSANLCQGPVHIPTLTRYGNNPLVGDIGNLANLTSQARSDGRELHSLLGLVLEDIRVLESSAKYIMRNLDNEDKMKKITISKETAECATKLIERVVELRDFVVLRIKVSSDTDETNENEEEVGVDAVRHRLEEHGNALTSSSVIGMVSSAVQAFVNMIDPPPHNSIFGLDVVRGCFLARYAGAHQFWVKRSSSGGSKTFCGGNGKLDVVMIPSLGGTGRNSELVDNVIPLSPRNDRNEVITSSSVGRANSISKIRKAVLYCNPNAGLVEVATGMGLTGGNVQTINDGDDSGPTCWAEYYIEHGYDVYLFNYAGYGRSYGGNRYNNPTTEFSHGVLGSMKRFLFSTFLAFKPSSESLKLDALAVARHLVDVVGIDELIIHGESIGGMAAAGAARTLSATTGKPKSSLLLVCDRTFSNLEGVAQRLVGRWTGNAIRLLTPGWSTDVARDFIAARCPKIVAQDCADEIIHDYSSLKSGVSFAGELTRGQTNNVGWMMSPPIDYRVADLDNVSIINARCNTHQVSTAPTWPSDKHISWSEAHHFAACIRRIGKVATAAKKHLRGALEDPEVLSEGAEGIEMSLASDESSQLFFPVPSKCIALKKMTEAEALIEFWKLLACCDGLCGNPLGHAVKEGSDCTISWLCSSVIFGPQVLVEHAEKRWDEQLPNNSYADSYSSHCILPEDFDMRPRGYKSVEDSATKYPTPMPEILASLNVSRSILLKQFQIPVQSELDYVTGMLQYIVDRISSKEIIALSLRRRNGGEDENGTISTGCFLNLTCGHNNQYSSEERERLMKLIFRASGDSV